MTVTLDELRIGDHAPPWEQAGFSVLDDVARVGGIDLRLVGGDARGIVGWSLGGLPQEFTADDLDGIPTQESTSGLFAASTHANGVIDIDHVVLLSPHLARSVDALAAIGLNPRRERDGELGGAPMRQVFYRLGETILEVVGAPDAEGDGPSSLWGITFTVLDIDTSAAFFGDHASPVKDAVQPGRRITTLRHRDLGLSVRTALISPAVR